MTVYYVLSLFAPYITFLLCLYKKLDIKSTIIYVLSFNTCFLTSVFLTPFLGVVSGICVYVIAMVLIEIRELIVEKFNCEKIINHQNLN